MVKNSKDVILKSSLGSILHFNIKLFLFFIILLTAFDLKGLSPHDKDETVISYPNLIHDSISVKQYHHHKPLKSFPTPYQEEAADDHESLEYNDDDIGALDWSVSTGGGFKICFSVKRLYIQLLQSYQNQPQVALFILHHSWKIYLIA